MLLLAVAPRLSGQATKPAAIAKSGTPAVKPVWPDEGPLKWAPRPTVSEITANDLRTRLYQFADDSMMGRKIGELGNLKGTAYIAAEFKRLGLKPGGDNGTYFQLPGIGHGPTGFDSVTARLAVGGSALTQKTEWIPMAAAANTGIRGTLEVTSAPTVFAGIWGDSSTALDPAVFRGKVGVFAAGAPAANGGRGTGGGRSGAGGGRGRCACGVPRLHRREYGEHGIQHRSHGDGPRRDSSRDIGRWCEYLECGRGEDLRQAA